MNLITGLPRSGSTLLCNILNQNPNFYATSTSPLSGCFAKILRTLSNSSDIKGDLGRDRTSTERRIKRSLKTFCQSWHHDHAGKQVFDKSRAWGKQVLSFLEIYPDAKIIVTVRDLRDIFASVEKQNRKSALFREEADLTQTTLAQRLDRMFTETGLIGGPLMGVKDCILRKLPVYFLKYEDLAADPKAAMNKLYCYLLEDEFEHDFEDVEDTSTDPDHLYLFKYPHKGSGKVRPTESEWKEYFVPEVAETIMERYKWFTKEFGYVD